jgi:RNA polymerase sigma-70 factor (ECF subfamily)
MADAVGSVDAARLFEQYGPSLYRFARVLLHNSADAEDVVQSAFLRLIQHLQANRDRTNVRAWLFTVAANLARDRMRLRRRWAPWDSAAGEPITLELAPQENPYAQFLAAAAKLAPRDRLLLALRAQGLSYREIAEAANVRATSVGRLLARALERWRRARETIAIS